MDDTKQGEVSVPIVDFSPHFLWIKKIQDNVELSDSPQFNMEVENTNPSYPLSNIQITNNCPKTFSFSNNCTTLLNPLSSCQINGQFNPEEPGEHSCEITFYSYELGKKHILLLTNVTKVTVQGHVSQGLPENTEKDTTYPVVLTFSNANTKLPATGIKVIRNFPAGFTEASTGTTCKTGMMLVAGSSCQISGTYKATKTGAMAIGATLEYNEGQPVTVETTSNVTDVDVRGTLSTVLPANTEKDTTYPVVLTFSNANTKLPATGIKVIRNFPAGFTEASTGTTCKTGMMLVAGSSCQISGTYKATKTGAMAIGATLEYNEGQPVTVETTSNVTDVDVRGTLSTVLPANTEKDTAYPVVLTFSNANTKLPATGIKVIRNFPAGFTEASTGTTCKTGMMLVAGSSCQISGTYKATKTGAMAIGATLEYNEGQPVTVETVSSNAR